MIIGIRGKIRNTVHSIQHTMKVISQSGEEPSIYYFGVPMHANLGDLAQCMCIRQWLRTSYPEYKVVEVDSKVFMEPSSSLRIMLKKRIKINDLIVFQSGYCTQDIGGVEDLMHQAVMIDYPDNKLIMLPQTVYFQDEKRKKQASDIYDAHQHLFFLARDQVSYNLAKEMFPHRPVYAYPDIVTTLIGRYSFDTKRSGILLCMRNDSEKYYTNDEIDRLQALLLKIDRVEKLDTTIPKKLNAETRNLNTYIEEFIQKFAEFKLVITDRYHGTIFSLVADTPVIVLKTNDHKVRTGVDWFKGLYDRNVKYVDSIDGVVECAKEIMARNQKVENRPFFEKEYYAKLRELIEASLEG